METKMKMRGLTSLMAGILFLSVAFFACAESPLPPPHTGKNLRDRASGRP